MSPDNQCAAIGHTIKEKGSGSRDAILPFTLKIAYVIVASMRKSRIRSEKQQSLKAS